MTTARVLSPAPQPRVGFQRGKRITIEECVVDLGVFLLELHRWSDARSSVSEQSTTVLRVEKGFPYDGASIPWLAQPLMGARERFEVASLFHDALYRWQAPREVADEVFWIISRSGGLNVGTVRGWLGWVGLRVGGWAAYRKRKRQAERAAS